MRTPRSRCSGAERSSAKGERSIEGGFSYLPIGRYLPLLFPVLEICVPETDLVAAGLLTWVSYEGLEQEPPQCSTCLEDLHYMNV